MGDGGVEEAARTARRRRRARRARPRAESVDDERDERDLLQHDPPVTDDPPLRAQAEHETGERRRRTPSGTESQTDVSTERYSPVASIGSSVVVSAATSRNEHEDGDAEPSHRREHVGDECDATGTAAEVEAGRWGAGARPGGARRCRGTRRGRWWSCPYRAPIGGACRRPVVGFTRTAAAVRVRVSSCGRTAPRPRPRSLPRR